MIEEQKLRYNLATLCSILFLITAVRIYFLYVTDIELWVDEAQYWLWSKKLDYGYFSKPPVIAYLIAFGTDLFGNHEFGIRFLSPILHLSVAFLTYLIAAECFEDKSVAYYSALSYIALPAVSFSSIFISSDAPLIFFWALGVYAFVKINKNNFDENFKYWILFALAVGFGMLSKYTFIAFLFSVTTYYLFNNLSKLFSINFIGAVMFALLIFTPNILWNINNGFVSFSHTGTNVISKEFSIYPQDLVEFIGGQFGVFGPILALFSINAFYQHSRNKTKLAFEDNFKPVKILNYFTIPLLVAGCFTALIAGAQAHWAAPAYISGNILVVRYLLKTEKKFWLNFSLIISFIIFAMILNAIPIARAVSFIKDPFERVRLWHKPAEHFKYLHFDEDQSIILADERKIIAPLIYNMAIKNKIAVKIFKWSDTKEIRDYYEMEYKYKNQNAENIYFITRAMSQNKLKRYFREVYLEKTLDKKYNLKIYRVKK